MENNKNMTSLQELIKIIDDYIEDSEGDIRYEDECYILNEVKKDALSLLVKEKNQIIKAIEWAVDMINEQEKAIAKDEKDYDPSFHELFPEDYYNAHFNQKK